MVALGSRHIRLQDHVQYLPCRRHVVSTIQTPLEAQRRLSHYP